MEMKAVREGKRTRMAEMEGKKVRAMRRRSEKWKLRELGKGVR